MGDLDPTSFTTPRALLGLYAHMATQKRYDRRGTDRIFKAIALTDSMPLNRLALRTGNFETLGTRRVVRARIRGELYAHKDPHSRLDDPCTPAFADKPDAALAIIMQHTLCVTSKSFSMTSTQTINKGDEIRISCRINKDGETDVEYATILNVVRKADTIKESENISCAEIVKDFSRGTMSMGDWGHDRCGPGIVLQKASSDHKVPESLDRLTLDIAKVIDESTTKPAAPCTIPLQPPSEDIVKSCAPLDPAKVRQVAERMKAQWTKADGSRLTEKEAAAIPLQRAYWGYLYSSYCDDDSKWGPGREDGHRHWSAAFITALAAHIGATGFPASSNHHRYDLQGWDNRKKNTGDWWTFSLQSEAVWITPGDVLTYPSYCKGCTYEYGHADMVWKIENNKIYLIGGNLSNTVLSGMNIPYANIGGGASGGAAVLGKGYNVPKCVGCGSSAGNYALVLKKIR